MANEKTSKLTWFALGLCVLIGAIVVATKDDIPAKAASCPPIEAGALWLPDSHRQYSTAFEAKARRVHQSGRCVIEGSWGTQQGRFYLAVHDAGSPRAKAYHLRFTAEELSR